MRFTRWLLARLLPADVRASVLGDLDAEFERRRNASLDRPAHARWYRRQVAGSIGPALSMRFRRASRVAADAWQDARFGTRLLVRQPAYTVTAGLTLALGIGANTAIFSVVDGVLLRPLPYRDPTRLVRIWSANPRGITRNGISPADFFDWREQARGLDAMAGFTSVNATLTGAGDPLRLTGAAATANLADTLGMDAIVGRWFAPSETAGPADAVVVLSEALWRSHFDASPDIAGRRIVLDDRPRTIVGVMPRAFAFPTTEERFWEPLPDDWRSQARDAHYMEGVARLATGVGLDAARDSLRTVARSLEGAYPATNRGWSVTVIPLREALAGGVRTQLLVLCGAVAAMLLVACANVAGLGLARTASRSQELALRAAIGASGSRLLRQMLVEGGVLSVAGCAGALALAAWSIRALTALPSAPVPLLERVELDVRVMLIAAVLTCVSALASGVLPAWHASRRRGVEALASGSRATPASTRLRHAIVCAQVAIATALVAGGLLLVRSLARLTAVPSGFQADQTVLGDISLPPSRYPRNMRAAFFDRALDRIRALPRVTAAGAGGPLPLSGQEGLYRFGVQAEGRELPAGSSDRAYVRWSTPGYFAAMGIRQHAGRPFLPSDTVDTEPIAIVDEEIVRRIFGGADPIGRRVKLSLQRDVWRRVVGVVGSVRQNSLDRGADPHVYLPESQHPSPALTVVVRASADPAATARGVREAVRAIDPDLPLSNVRSLDDLVAGSTSTRRLSAILLALFAGAAVLLTLVGVYGVVSQTVVQSTRELGVRIALGADGARMMRLTLGRSIAVTGAGALAGLALAWLTAPALRGLIYGLSPRDPSTLAAAAALLILTAGAAAYVPARRVLALDVVHALRND